MRMRTGLIERDAVDVDFHIEARHATLRPRNKAHTDAGSSCSLNYKSDYRTIFDITLVSNCYKVQY